MEERKTGLAPLCPGCARVLVLGSMPSEKSIAAGFYYANPRNAFWPVMARVLGELRRCGEQGAPALSFIGFIIKRIWHGLRCAMLFTAFLRAGKASFHPSCQANNPPKRHNTAPVR